MRRESQGVADDASDAPFSHGQAPTASPVGSLVHTSTEEAGYAEAENHIPSPYPPLASDAGHNVAPLTETLPHTPSVGGRRWPEPGLSHVVAPLGYHNSYGDTGQAA